MTIGKHGSITTLRVRLAWHELMGNAGYTCWL